ncbi:site-specific DNA-methyltransferase [Aquabacterium sp. G14]|uniref:site-specific DNA-methyltransferase n=1 Tax=Aquabacterium sp. G14 TaxID=3130164 RepID=UPI0030D7B0BC
MTDNIKKPKDVTVAKAKGRPMLTWVGKKPLARVKAYPAQAIEQFDAAAGQPVTLQEVDWSDWPKDLPHSGLLYHGDNKDVLAHLLANGFRGKVKLIYIDPPFDSGADYVRKVQLRGPKGTVKIDGEDYTLGEQVQYSDIWANDNYLQFMYERLLMLKELLATDGVIYLHCDSSRNSHLRLLLDEVFGPDRFINEIVWHYYNKMQGNVGRFASNHDVILSYRNGEKFSFTTLREAREKPKTQQKRVWDPASKSLKQARDDQGNLIYYEDTERTIDDVWRLPYLMPADQTEKLDYPTQKPERVLERVIESSTSAGDLVLDCFIGSGTTAAVAQRLGRRWIGCDINKGAIQTTSKRLQDLMRAQTAALQLPQQSDMMGVVDGPQAPCQKGFATYRVNDYDLQIQHNEAVELACQHLGVTRTRTDSFFEGTQGGRLVKIVPFNHPLSPLDLESVRNELKTRPTEERDVMVVCLGWQHDARAWVAAYNRNRPVNKLHVVELRTDRKLGGIIKHEPISAQVTAQRQGAGSDARLVVEIEDVVSPTIMQRLNLDQGIFRAQITDWRAVVDCILIDTQYDGQVFNVALADVPARKQDLVSGRYELPVPPEGAKVAVKVIDMLGEELVVTLDV